MDGQEHRKVKDLSGGQKRRLDLALGVVGNPRLLFLDEPTTGFDPSARQSAWQLVRDLRAAGTTIILTTHYMEEAQQLADRVAVIAAGAIVAEGDPATIGGRDRARARIHFTLPASAEFDDLPVTPTEQEGSLITIEIDDPTTTLHAVTDWALQRHTSLPDLAVVRPSLEEIYLQLTQSDVAARPLSVPAGRRPSRSLVRSGR